MNKLNKSRSEDLTSRIFLYLEQKSRVKMASFSSSPHYSRSSSFPSRTNLTVSQLDEQIRRIRSSESASSSISSSISSKLAHLGNLYDCLDEFLQMPSSRQALLCQGNDKCVEDALEGSVKLLDVCSIITDVFTQMKERSQELQSILRRRCSDDEISKEVAKYLKFKKMAIKAFSKALKDLKKMESNENTNMISGLKECQMVTLNVLKSILVAMVGPKASLKRSSWQSVISRMMKSKGIACQPEMGFFLVEFEAIYAASYKEKARIQLENMEIYIKDAEEGVEILFRHLIKTRTTILNILNY